MEAPNQEIKKDAGKNRLALVPVEAVLAIGKVLTFGCKKYSANSWREGMDYSRVYSAIQRHLNAFWGEGSDVDEESGLSHLSHAFCGLSFLLAYENNKERYRTFDDRVKNSPCVDDQPDFPDLTKMTHPEACEHLEVGMRVKVLCKELNHTRGWRNSWNSECMDEYINRILTVEGINGYGINFVEADWRSFPAFVLEIVSRPSKEASVVEEIPDSSCTKHWKER